jgi:hypothetical protein
MQMMAAQGGAVHIKTLWSYQFFRGKIVWQKDFPLYFMELV